MHSFLMGLFSRLRASVIMMTIEGIRDALVARDVQLAADVAIAGAIVTGA